MSLADLCDKLLLNLTTHSLSRHLSGVCKRVYRADIGIATRISIEHGTAS